MNAATVLELVNVLGVAVAAFFSWKAHRTGKKIPDAIELIKDIAQAEIKNN